MIQKSLIGTMLLGLFFLTGMKYPPNGTDYNSYRCTGGLISKGDRVQNLIETCGEPIREDKPDIQPERILIYRFDQSNVYILKCYQPHRQVLMSRGERLQVTYRTINLEW